MRQGLRGLDPRGLRPIMPLKSNDFVMNPTITYVNFPLGHQVAAKIVGWRPSGLCRQAPLP